MRRGLKIALLLAAPPVVGVALVYACVSVLGWLAVFSAECQFFGLPVTQVTLMESLLAWIPLSVLTGGAMAALAPRYALWLGLSTALCGLGWLLYGMWDITPHFLGEGFSKGFDFFDSLLIHEGVYLSASLLVGALLGRRQRRRRIGAHS
jgi:hypothetical protein